MSGRRRGAGRHLAPELKAVVTRHHPGSVEGLEIDGASPEDDTNVTSEAVD